MRIAATGERRLAWPCLGSQPARTTSNQNRGIWMLNLRAISRGALMAAGLCWSIGSLAAQARNSSSHSDQDRAVTGGGVLPAGWSGRPHEGGDLQNVKFVTMDPGYHLTLGPATI